MYRRFYGLNARPFDLTPNPRFVVLTNAHQEALSNLEYAIASRTGMTLLLGDAGTGKTTILRIALERQSQRVHTVYLQNPALTRQEFVQMLASSFGLGDDAAASKTTLLLKLEALLASRRRRGETTILVMDEAQSLSMELLEELRLLVNIETQEEKLLSVILAGQPELAGRLNQPQLRQLKQRIALRCELRPLTMLEGLAYVAGRIRAAGGVGAHIFTREAVILMHERAQGIPRTISVVAGNALIAGFATGQRPIRAATVEEVCRDLDLAGGAPAPASSRFEALEADASPPERGASGSRVLELGTSAGVAGAAFPEAEQSGSLGLPAPEAAPAVGPAADSAPASADQGPWSWRRRFGLS